MNDVAVVRFREWVARQGTSGHAAERLGCSRPLVSLLRTGKRRPGLALATRIEELTGIPARDWVTTADDAQAPTEIEAGPPPDQEAAKASSDAEAPDEAA